MHNVTQFKATPGNGNFTSNTGKLNQSYWGEPTGYGYSYWGEPTGYGYPLEGAASHGFGNTLGNFVTHSLLQNIAGTFGYNSPSLGVTSVGQDAISTVFQGQSLIQNLFSENGLVLGPIFGGADSFFGSSSETGEVSGISRFINLVQGVSAAQIIAHIGITGGQGNINTTTNQGQNVGSPLASLIHVRYFDNNSSFVIEAAIVGGNQKNLNVNVVGDEIRIQKTETTTSTGKHTAAGATQGNTGTFYSLPLPSSANSKGITATAKDGILTITLPKTAEITKNTRQIAVK
jgi:HSP20 family molecular chaperone IbpA